MRLGAQKRTPARATALWRGIDPGILQDLPYRRVRDLMAQPGQFTLDATMPPPGVLPSHRHDQPRDRHRGRWPTRSCRAWIGPPPDDQPPMPPQQRVRTDIEHLSPTTPRD